MPFSGNGGEKFRKTLLGVARPWFVLTTSITNPIGTSVWTVSTVVHSSGRDYKGLWMLSSLVYEQRLLIVLSCFSGWKIGMMGALQNTIGMLTLPWLLPPVQLSESWSLLLLPTICGWIRLWLIAKVEYFPRACGHDKEFWKLTSEGSSSVQSFYRFLINRGKRCRVTPIIFKCFVPRKINAYGLFGTKRFLPLIPYSPVVVISCPLQPVLCVTLTIRRWTTCSSIA